MKILLLNPHFDAWRNILQTWQGRGDAVLVPENTTEAWQLLQLHGPSLDLAIIHREQGPQAQDAGIKFIERVKADPALADLPLLITSEAWGDSEFAQHQSTHHGANAYLKWPFGQDQLFRTINSIFGLESLPAAQDTSIPTLETIPGLDTSSQIIQIEEVSEFFTTPEQANSASIKLDAPDLPEETPAEMPTLPPADPQQEPPLELSALIIPEEPAPLETPPESGPDDIAKAIEAAKAARPSAPLAEAANTESADAEAMREMPYLFAKGAEPPKAAFDPNLMFAQAVGDAIIPGSAGESPDADTLKKYLQLREKDVAVLSSQLKTAKNQILTLENLAQEERAKNNDLSNELDGARKKLAEAERMSAVEAEKFNRDLADIRFQMKSKTDKARTLEIQVREAAEEMERLRERVRSDIRKIRVREKELENKLEIMRKDSEVLIGAREGRIIELKRKLDLLEFNMDLLQDRYNREKENSAKLRERLTRAAQVVKVAGGFLDTPGAQSEDGNSTQIIEDAS